MKNMLGLFFVAALLLILSGCSSYYYSVLSSNDRAGLRSDLGDFVQETDTAVVSYSFNGENAPVSIIIYNKLDEPLFVDWSRSALIVDDIATAYHHERALIEGQADLTPYGESYQGAYQGSVLLPKGVSFIPPKSKIENIPLNLPGIPFDKIPKDEYRKQSLAIRNSRNATIWTKEFTESTSPLCFRSYLTLYTGDQNAKQSHPMFFERSFYISKLIKAGNISPDVFSMQQQQSGDFYYVRKTKGAKAGLIAGVIAVGALGVVVGVTIGIDGEDLDVGF